MLREELANKSTKIQALNNHIQENLPKKEATLINQFVEQFYTIASLEDLETHSTEDWYGSILGFWNFINKPITSKPHINIYNPNYEEHCWQSTHTIVEIQQEDMPFLVDSIRMQLDRLGLTTHMILHIGRLNFVRDKKGKIEKILPRSQPGKSNENEHYEALIYLEIDRQTDPDSLRDLEAALRNVLSEVKKSVTDWPAMRQKVDEIITELKTGKTPFEEGELEETCEFLKWLDNHFTFLGVRDYELKKKGKDPYFELVPNSGLGVLRKDAYEHLVCQSFEELTPHARQLLLSPCPLIMTKTNMKSIIHRNADMDYIGVKRLDKKGTIVGERRIIGLYTSAAYHTSPRYIPLLSRKIKQIFEHTHFNPKGHAGKDLLHILETMPRDDLLQGDVEELLHIAMGIYHLKERRFIKLFTRKDVYGRFVSCLVYVPRDLYNTQLRIQFEHILKEAFDATEINFSTKFSESILARIHFTVRVNSGQPLEFDRLLIEEKLRKISRTWEDDLIDYLRDTYGEEKGNHFVQKYTKFGTFPASYRENYSSLTALHDIKHAEELFNSNQEISMNFYQPVDDLTGLLRFKIYRKEMPIPLSDVLPILENLNLRVITEAPYKITTAENGIIWINDFGMKYKGESQLDIDALKPIYQEAFEKIWKEQCENDGFNKLVLSAGLTWREVSLLRTYSKYLRQIRFNFSQNYIEETMIEHAEIAKKLILLFKQKFFPEADKKTTKHELATKIIKEINKVTSLDDDRILRRFLEVIKATVRTNFYQKTAQGEFKAFVAIKINSKAILDMPKPVPHQETFVCSPQFEAIRLANAPVARGGLRWSDRREDFRTEILGLMKAQRVKNAVIVPDGAKGGFILKNQPLFASRDEHLAYAINCYQNFIRGMLDVTDNLLPDGTIQRPENTIAYDGNDTYLVVAADKGTATFSDIANEISKEYNYWLGDAFASGGSAGYDHKKMKITARGGWESVKRSFRELGKDIQTTDFTAIGIGDMAGDVFGNGMLQSKHIRLVGAFNHMHIFLDPNPDSATSFKERERLFKLPRSTWEDYNKACISKGGGIFSRLAKEITLSPEVKKCFGIKQDKLEPNKLIRYLLKAPVDLFWSGGIGTFVKASYETHVDVGDKTNDLIRINGNELRCKVVGEGGNLGLTQGARIEYSIKGGLVYGDFIDNSGGVDCSDHEVNIKIFLNKLILNEDLTEKQRNQLLFEMTDEVAELVLLNNYRQTQAISLAYVLAPKNLELHSRFMKALETSGKLDRALEFLPDEETLMERKQVGKGLLKPGIGILFAYSKSLLKEQILESDVPEDPFLKNVLLLAFPPMLRKKYKEALLEHSLKREIIATQLSNQIVNEMGFAFIYRLHDETGAPPAAIVRAYTIARFVFDIESTWVAIEKLDNKIPAEKQMAILMYVVRLLRRSTHWLLKNQRFHLDLAASIDKYSDDVKRLRPLLPTLLHGEELNRYERLYKEYKNLKIPEPLAKELAMIEPMMFVLDIIDGSHLYGLPLEKLAKTFYFVGESLEINWVRKQVIDHNIDNHWEALSREALRDDLDWQQRQLAVAILCHQEKEKTATEKLMIWQKEFSHLVDRWNLLLGGLKSSNTLDFTMFFVAARELLDLTQTSLQSVNPDIVTSEKLSARKKRLSRHNKQG